MKRMRRGIVVATGATLVAITTAIACGFPDVTFGDVTDSGMSEASVSGDEKPIDALGVGEAGATMLTDGSVIAEGGACLGADPCDCDNDNHRALVCDGGDGGGGDCNDRDGFVYPRAIDGYISNKPTSPNLGDWNCMNGVERQYEAGLDCSLVVNGCKGVGFLDPAPVPCGENEVLYTCSLGGTLPTDCSPRMLGTRVQGCR